MAKEVFISPLVRGSFVYLNSPRQDQSSDKEHYSIDMMLEKDNPKHKAFRKKILKAAEQMRNEKWGDPKQKKYKCRLPVKDGDEEMVDGWENHWTIKAKTTRRPNVVDKHRHPEDDPNEIYSGAYYHVSFSLYPWEHKEGGRGISASLNNVMKVKDGEPFDGRTDPEDDFKDMDYGEEFDDDEEDDVL